MKNVAICAFLIIASSSLQAIAADVVSTPGAFGLEKPTIKLLKAKAAIVNKEGTQIGLVSLKQVAENLMLRVKITDLPVGLYTIRLHEVGLCEPETGFLSAGKKIKSNITNAQNDKNNQFPYFFSNEDKKVEINWTIKFIALSSSDNNTINQNGYLLDKDGTAVVLYKKEQRNILDKNDKSNMENKNQLQTKETPASGEIVPIACGTIK